MAYKISRSGNFAEKLASGQVIIPEREIFSTTGTYISIISRSGNFSILRQRHACVRAAEQAKAGMEDAGLAAVLK